MSLTGLIHKITSVYAPLSACYSVLSTRQNEVAFKGSVTNSSGPALNFSRENLFKASSRVFSASEDNMKGY